MKLFEEREDRGCTTVMNASSNVVSSCFELTEYGKEFEVAADFSLNGDF